MNLVCDWYDYQTKTCNIDDRICAYCSDNDNGIYGLCLTCEKNQNDEEFLCRKEVFRTAIDVTLNNLSNNNK